MDAGPLCANRTILIFALVHYRSAAIRNVCFAGWLPDYRFTDGGSSWKVGVCLLPASDKKFKNKFSIKKYDMHCMKMLNLNIIWGSDSEHNLFSALLRQPKKVLSNSFERDWMPSVGENQFEWFESNPSPCSSETREGGSKWKRHSKRCPSHAHKLWKKMADGLH